MSRSLRVVEARHDECHHLDQIPLGGSRSSTTRSGCLPIPVGAVLKPLRSTRARRRGQVLQNLLGAVAVRDIGANEARPASLLEHSHRPLAGDERLVVGGGDDAGPALLRRGHDLGGAHLLRRRHRLGVAASASASFGRKQWKSQPSMPKESLAPGARVKGFFSTVEVQARHVAEGDAQRALPAHAASPRPGGRTGPAGAQRTRSPGLQSSPSPRAGRGPALDGVGAATAASLDYRQLRPWGTWL
jgi:hypothetical protein